MNKVRKPSNSVIHHRQNPIESTVYLNVGFEVLTPVVLIDYCLLRYNAVYSVVTCFTLVSYLPYYSTLKTEAIFSSETSVNFQRTIPEDRTLLLI
jgi:hypothetical protein